MTTRSGGDARRMAASERSGVLFPERLARYAATWIPPGPAVADVVDQYWHVSWSLDDGERLDQPIIDLPAVTLTVEHGDVPAPLVVTGVHGRAWRRAIQGRGRVFAIRLRPAGLAALSDLRPGEVADATVSLTTSLDPRLHALMSGLPAYEEPEEQARAADTAIRDVLVTRPPQPAGLLANDVLDELRVRVRTRAGPSLAAQFGCSERTIQRACVGTLGHGPKWLSCRIRLQEAALAIVTRPPGDLAAIAVDLGYADQSHLTQDFRAVTGLTPDAYRRAVGRLAV